MKEMVARVGDTLLQSGIESVCLTGEELVRCKDCKRKDTLSCPKAPVRPDDWFCADGKRRDNDG